MSRPRIGASAYAIRSVTINQRGWSVFFLLLVPVVAALIFFSSSQKASAATRTWDGGGPTNLWNDAQNWSPDIVPVSGDIAVFNGLGPNGHKPALIATNVNVAGIQIAGYGGTIQQLSGVTITVGSSNFSQSSGQFVGGNSGITINGDFSLLNGLFVGGSSSMDINGDLTISAGQFVSTTGTYPSLAISTTPAVELSRKMGEP